MGVHLTTISSASSASAAIEPGKQAARQSHYLIRSADSARVRFGTGLLPVAVYRLAP